MAVSFDPSQQLSQIYFQILTESNRSEFNKHPDLANSAYKFNDYSIPARV